jgi:PIN domain nuclease of toxin-antitoxin system
VTVLDAYALLAYLRAETAADEVAELLGGSTSVSALNVAEVMDQLVRVHGRDADDVHADLALLAEAGMYVLPVDAESALLAGRLRSLHYHRERRPVSLADCIAAATALRSHRSLATSDPDLAAMLRVEGGTVHALPDSAGRRP